MMCLVRTNHKRGGASVSPMISSATCDYDVNASIEIRYTIRSHGIIITSYRMFHTSYRLNDNFLLFNYYNRRYFCTEKLVYNSGV